MWTSNNYKFYKKEYNFKDSRGGTYTYSVLEIDEIIFFNMIELLEFELEFDMFFQSILCEYCGFPGCGSGSWLDIKRVKDFILFIPVFDSIFENNISEYYFPPINVEKKGAFYLSLKEFDKFKKLIPIFDKLETIKYLSKYELMSLFNWDSPLNLSSNKRSQKLSKNDIIATSHLDIDSIFEIINNKLIEIENSKEFELILIENLSNVITIYLDDYKNTKWDILYNDKGYYKLILGEKFIIETNK